MSERADNAQPVTPAEDFEDLFENAPCGYLTMKPDARIVRVNALLADWTGYTSDQLIGKRLHDMLTVGTRILYETSFAPQLSLHGVCEEMSLDLRTAAGENIAVSASGRVRKDADGQPVLTRVVFLKVAERRRYERQLVDARTQSQTLLDSERATSELREQFLAVLGHDLRNPLASIDAGARLLQKEVTTAKGVTFVSLIQNSVGRMAELIDNVLDLARGRLGGGLTLERAPQMQLGSVLEQVVDELRTAWPDRVIETHFLMTRPVSCDRARIAQLLSNLVGNALTHGASDEPIRVDASTQEDAFELSVANKGSPIPPVTLDRLFQPFFRVASRPGQQGLGLGLYIASEIARAHNGTLEVASSPEETRFSFRMPLV